MRHFVRDARGTIMIEMALVCALFVLPVAIGIGACAPAVVNWITHTAANLKQNSALQQENNALLHQLLAKQGQSAPASS